MTYTTPPRTCVHGRQTCNCAICAPAADAAYRIAMAEPRMECDECGAVVPLTLSRMGEIHGWGCPGAFRLVSPAGRPLTIVDPQPHHNMD